MSTCVEIISLLDQKNPQAIVKYLSEQAGVQILASRMYEELERVLIFVQLSPPTDEHTLFLQWALQRGLIESYEFMTCYPVSVFLDLSRDRDEYMRGFPLREGESWYPALDHLHKVYICLSKPFLTSTQTTWLNQHQARWEFEDSQVASRTSRWEWR